MMKRKHAPHFEVIDGGSAADPLSARNSSCADYYDVFTDPAGVTHYKPGGYYYRSEMVSGLYWDKDYAKAIAFAAFRELEMLREWVNNTLEFIPPRWSVTSAESDAKAGLHPDFLSTRNKMNAS